jgi:hypothetical protein
MAGIRAGTRMITASSFRSNTATGGSGHGLARGYGGAIVNLNGTVKLNQTTLSGNTASNGDGTPGTGAALFNLSHNAGNTASGQTSRADIWLTQTTISSSNGDLVNQQVNGISVVHSGLLAPPTNFTATPQ